mgnify:CR=1 FL=1
MRQTRKRNVLLFTTLGIVAVLLLLTDMATGDTYIPISKIGAVLTGGECDEMTRNILLSIRFIRVVVAEYHTEIPFTTGIDGSGGRSRVVD